MSFVVAGVIETREATVLLGPYQKIRLGGPGGPLALRILNLPDGRQEWSVSGSELASESLSVPSAWLLWVDGQGTGIPFRVGVIFGQSTELQTELLVQMEILERVGDGFLRTGKESGESLRLLGGRSTPHAAWTWAAPKMSIGSLTVGKQNSVASG